MQEMMKQFKAARRVSTPLIAIRTPDPAATIEGISAAMNGSAPPMLQWDAVRGVNYLNESGNKAMAAMTGDEFSASGADIVSTLEAAVKLPQKSILFVHNAQRTLDNLTVMQAAWNLRDTFKSNYRTLVMLGPDFELPAELANDILVLDEPLPLEDELALIVRRTYEAAELQEPESTIVEQAVSAIAGLAAFPAEQVTAMSLTPDGLNLGALWERKRQVIEQTPGLAVWRGGERFVDIGGIENIKSFLSRVIQGTEPPRAIVFIDEIEKAMAGAGGDTSGVAADQLGTLLSYMQDNRATGIICIGPPGCQPAGSQVLMGDGTWNDIENVKVGDYVMSPQHDGKMVPSLITEVASYENQDIVEIRTKGRSTKSYRCSSDHILPYLALQRRRHAGTRSRSTELNETTVLEFLCRGKDHQKKARVFTSPAFDLPERSYRIHPYIMGLMLGDGCLTGTMNNPTFTTTSEELLQAMSDLGCEVGKSPIRSCGVWQKNIVGETAVAFKESPVWGCNSHSKFVPYEYKIGSLQQRLELLAGLVDTDGTGSTAFVSVSKMLADDFAYLIHSVGGWANVKEYKATYKGKESCAFMVHYSLAEHIIPTRLAYKRAAPRDLEWKNPRHRAFEVRHVGKGTVYGFNIASPSRWYVTDDWIVTHNTSKSMLAKATGNEAGVPTIALDFGAMKGSLVGQSEQNLRTALKVVKAMSQDRTLFIATCNSLGILPPELRRRFTFGTFFFDLPTAMERANIWQLYIQRYNIADANITFNDEGWTGAEIKQCCEIAYRLRCSLTEAAAYIVPVARSAADQIEQLRTQASGRFIAASQSGIYTYEKHAAITPAAGKGRAIEMENA